MLNTERKRKMEANLWKFYLLNAIPTVSIVSSIFVLFFQDIGLSLTEITMILSIYSIAIAILALPGGFFADMFGRKPTLILAGVFYTLSALVFSLSTTFFDILLAYILLAIGISLMWGGVIVAFLYETLKELNQTKSYKKILGRADFYSSLIAIVAISAGGILGSIDIRLPYYATTLSAFLIIVVSYTLTEPKRQKYIFKQNNLLDSLKTLLNEILKNKKLKWMIFFSGVFSGLIWVGYWFYQPYFKLSNLDLVYFGFVFASFTLFNGLGSKYAYKIEEKLGLKQVLVLSVILSTTAYALLGFFVSSLSFLFVFVIYFVMGVSNIITNNYINNLIKSNNRAIILSINLMLLRLVGAICIFLLGGFAELYTLSLTFILISCLILFIGGLFLLKLYKIKAI